MTTPTYNYKAPEQEASLTISDEQLIKTYNAILTFGTNNAFFAASKQDMRDQLINRNIITEDHEGEIVT